MPAAPTAALTVRPPRCSRPCGLQRLAVLPMEAGEVRESRPRQPARAIKAAPSVLAVSDSTPRHCTRAIWQARVTTPRLSEAPSSQPARCADVLGGRATLIAGGSSWSPTNGSLNGVILSAAGFRRPRRATGCSCGFGRLSPRTGAGHLARAARRLGRDARRIRTSTASPACAVMSYALSGSRWRSRSCYCGASCRLPPAPTACRSPEVAAAVCTGDGGIVVSAGARPERVDATLCADPDRTAAVPAVPQAPLGQAAAGETDAAVTTTPIQSVEAARPPQRTPACLGNGAAARAVPGACAGAPRHRSLAGRRALEKSRRVRALKYSTPRHSRAKLASARRAAAASGTASTS